MRADGHVYQAGEASVELTLGIEGWAKEKQALINERDDVQGKLEDLRNKTEERMTRNSDTKNAVIELQDELRRAKEERLETLNLLRAAEAEGKLAWRNCERGMARNDKERAKEVEDWKGRVAVLELEKENWKNRATRAERELSGRG